MKLHLNSKATNGLILTVFIGLIIWGLVDSRWESSYIEKWTDINRTTPFYSSMRGSEAPYIKSIGDINSDGYSDTLIYDSFEKSMTGKYSEGRDLYEFSEYELVYEALRSINNSLNYFANYGKTTLAVRSIKGDADHPIFLWKKTLEGMDIMKCEIINDVNNDGIKDIFIQVGNLRNLPFLDQGTYFDYFKSNYWDFQNYFTYEYFSNQMFVYPKYLNYEIRILSGATGLDIKQTSITPELNSSRCILQLIELNRTDSDTINPRYILLTTSYSAPQYYSPYHMNMYAMDERNYGIHGLTFDYSTDPQKIVLKNAWERYGTDFNVNDSIDLPEFSGNTTFYYANRIQLKSLGTHFLIEFTTAYMNKAWYGYTYRWFQFHIGNDLTFVIAYNGTDGSKLWQGNYNLTYVSKDIDLDGDGFGQVFAYYNESTDMLFAIINPMDGTLISKAKLLYNPNNLITTDNLNLMKVIISDDDKMGNDNFLELIIIAFNDTYFKEYQPFQNKGDPIQFGRLSINYSSNIAFYLTPVTNFNIRIINYYYLFYNAQLLSTGVDFDRDGWLDYFFLVRGEFYRVEYPMNPSSIEDVGPISGRGVVMHCRNIVNMFSLYKTSSEVGTIDQRRIDEMLIFMNNPIQPEKIGLINGNALELVYIQDFNTFEPQIPFIRFFNGAVLLTSILIGLLGFCAFIFIKSLVEIKKGREPEEIPKFNNPNLKITKKINIATIIMMILIVMIQQFFTQEIDLTIGYTDVSITPEGQIIWFLILYPSILGLFVLIPIVYEKAAATFADNLYVKGQSALYSFFTKTKRKDYKIIIVEIPREKPVSPVKRLTRMLLPMLIAITVGISIYQGLGPDGGLYKALSPNFIDHPLTNPGALGIIDASASSASELWVEMGKFARYCVQPMIITYLGIVFIIPGSWLLDESGVCYYEKALATRDISDIDSISKWALNIISGLFGFTAITSFAGLFTPMISRMDELLVNLDLLSEVPAVYGVVIVFLILIVIPIMAGVLFMMAAMGRMEVNYEYNINKLYKRLEKRGIDTTPYDISIIFKSHPRRVIEIEKPEPEKEDTIK